MQRRGGRIATVLLLLLCPFSGAHARASHSDVWARDKFALAERMREALNGRPVADRARTDYQHVIDAYRRVYFGAPASSKADPSVVAVAELQVEMGRRLNDNKILRQAVKQYEFLRHEYPGSKYRFDALFTIGEIYKDDLDDPEEALATFEEFLHRYPRHRLANDARDAIAELNQTAAQLDGDRSRRQAALREAEKYQKAADFSGNETSPSADEENTPEAEVTQATEHTAPESSSHKLPRVTMIRHWSTPDYTRVAIDLEQDVKFGSQRIDHPDRIFFDLYNTRLASTLVGKSFDVDDGFLKKVRVAQYKPGRTRVVLEVDNLSDYNAFLLSNPSRLIIDIHGKQEAAAAKETAVKPAKAELKTSPAETESEAEKTDVDKDGKVEMAAKVATVEEASASDPEPRPEAYTTPKKPAIVHTMNGKIPKTIVEADDEPDEPTPKPKQVASLRVEDLRPDVVPTKKVKPASADSVDADAPPSERKSASSARSKNKLTTADQNEDIAIREAQPTSSGDRSLTRALD